MTNPKYFEFQICDWNYYHEIENLEEKYVMQLFGRTEDDKDVCLKITDFTPFFYIEIPNDWTIVHVNKLIAHIKRRIKYRVENNERFRCSMDNSLVDYKIVKKHKFYNFSNKKYFNFLMMSFKSWTTMREYSSILSYPVKINELSSSPITFSRFESNIEPHIRFMHIKNIMSCGWISINEQHLHDLK